MNSFKPNSNFNIEVFDNVLSFEQVDYLDNFLGTAYYSYRSYDATSLHQINYQFPKLINKFVINGKLIDNSWKPIVDKMSYFTNNILDFSLLNSPSANLSMQVNVSNPFTSDNVHQDFSTNEKGFTVIYYANKKWDVNYGGETLFYDNNLEPIAAIKPSPGRFVIFDSKIYHSARPPQSNCPYNRYTIAIKFKSNSLENKN